MKRYLLLLLLPLLWGCSPDASARIPIGMFSGGEAYCEAAYPASCMFYWDGDHPSGPLWACFANGTASKEGTNNGVDLSTSYGQDGIGALLNHRDDDITWVVSGDDGFADSQGTAWMSTYLTADLSSTIWLLQSYTDADNNFRFSVINTEKLQVRHEGNTTVGDKTGNDAISLTTWTRTATAWQVGEPTGKTSVQVGSEGWEEDATQDVDDFGNAPDGISIGRESAGSADETYWIDNVCITSGYQDADAY